MRYFLFILLFSIFVGEICALEKAWDDRQQYEARNQINTMIKGLDAPFKLRQKYVDELVKLADEHSRSLLFTQLVFGLNLKNDQITQGILEAYSRINEPATIPNLIGELLYSKSLDVRRSVIIHLPLFYVTNNDDRAEIRDFFEMMERFLPARLLATLREPPLIDGRYSNVRDKLRRETETTLTEQLQPVEAVLQGLETSYHKLAFEQLKHFLSIDLGHSKSKWVEFWRGHGETFISPLQDELFDTQITACLMLANMGAEGTEDLCHNIRWAMATPFNVLRTAVLEMLSIITSVAVAESRANQVALQTTITHQAEKLWRERQQTALLRLQNLILELAKKYLSNDNPTLNLLLIDGLGETRLPAAMPLLREILRSDNTSLDVLLRVAKALGKIGDEEAVKFLTMMAEYQGIAVKREAQIHEYQRVRGALRALSNITAEVDHDQLIVRNRQAALLAVDYLLTALIDERRVIGAPLGGKAEEQTIAFLTRQILRETWSSDERSFSPDTWRKIYEQLINK